MEGLCGLQRLPHQRRYHVRQAALRHRCGLCAAPGAAGGNSGLWEILEGQVQQEAGKGVISL